MGAEAAQREQLEEELLPGFCVRGIEHLRGKNPDGTPSFGEPPGGCG
jgi:hypothetical protein